MHAFKIEKKNITKSMAGILAYKTHAHYKKKKKKKWMGRGIGCPKVGVGDM